MTLLSLIKKLQELAAQGHGDLPVYSTHSASGDVNPVSGGHVSDYVGDQGPFDLEKGSDYVNIHIGN